MEGSGGRTVGNPDSPQKQAEAYEELCPLGECGYDDH